jgi:hypothetical protein
MKLELFLINPLCGLATSGCLDSVGLLYGILSTRVAVAGQKQGCGGSPLEFGQKIFLRTEQISILDPNPRSQLLLRTECDRWN